MLYAGGNDPRELSGTYDLPNTFILSRSLSAKNCLGAGTSGSSICAINNLQGNIDEFRISTSKNGFTTYPKEGHYEGGKSGIKNLDYYFDNIVKTDTIKIIPFINPNGVLAVIKSSS